MMLERKPEEMVLYVLVFLPGFLCLTLVGVIVDLTLTEFEFTYTAVGLSIVIFVISLGLAKITMAINRRRKLSSSTCGKGGSSTGAGAEEHEPAFLFWLVSGFCLPSVLVVGWLVGVAVQENWLTGAIRALAPVDILKESRGTPEYVVIKSHNECRMWEHDSRPAGVKDADGNEIVYQAAHKHWLRIRMENGEVYEGFPETFEISSRQSQYYLSPACRLVLGAQGDGEGDFRRVKGPGVLVRGGRILSIEFLDSRDSDCHYLYYQKRGADKCHKG